MAHDRMTERTSIVRRDAARPDLLIFDVVAKIDKPGIEAMAAAVDRAFDRHDEIDILVVFQAFEGIALNAALDGPALSVEVRAMKHVRRYAVVGAPALARLMIAAFNPVSPIDAKTFDREEEPQARRWIDGPT